MRRTLAPAALCSGAALLVLLLNAGPAVAQPVCAGSRATARDCPPPASDLPTAPPGAGPASGAAASPAGSFADIGFSISVEGRTLAGAPPPLRSPQPAAEAAGQGAAAPTVELRFDGLAAQRLLNVSTDDLRSAFKAGERIRFRAAMNYPVFVARAEVRVIDRTRAGGRVLARLPVLPNGIADWAMPPGGPKDLAYVLRVYDRAGRFDETLPLPLTRIDRALMVHETAGGPLVAAGEGEDRTRLRNIPLRGGTVTVFGTGVAPGGRVTVMGDAVPVDGSGSFAVSRILPPGDHVVIVDPGGGPVLRDVSIPRQDWFGVGLADLTFARRLGDEPARADPAFEHSQIEGRLAFYGTGRLANGVAITASLDTGDGPLEDMFSRLDDKDPRRVLDRLDPEDMYPTYGDDSTAHDDTPTSGRFYLKAEQGGSSLTWGDFKAGITGSKLISNTRALYGAQAQYAAPGLTAGGDPAVTATVYVAQPETRRQTDVLRGTGGSTYFLSRRDIDAASETVATQIVDPDTARIIETRVLTAGVGYEIDYLQGVILLTEPLESSMDGSRLIRDGTAGQYDVNLVVQYEYTPLAANLDGAAHGGRIELRPAAPLTFGVTAMQDGSGEVDLSLAGVDLRYDLGERSHILGEIAQSDGPGFDRTVSTNGGLTLTQDGPGTGQRAVAYSLDARLDLADLGLPTAGEISLYAERKAEGFSTLSETIPADQTVVGFTAEMKPNDRVTFGIAAESAQSDLDDSKLSGELRLGYALSPVWTVEGAVGRLDQTVAADPTKSGTRDTVALRLTYQGREDWSAYTFGQVTVADRGGLGADDRLGFGFDVQLSEKVALGAELSGGDQGPGAGLRLRYAPTADNELYLGYTLDPTLTGAGQRLVGQDDGEFVFGARYRQSEQLSTYYEDTWDLYGNRSSLVRAYGVTYTPDARWTWSGTVESGEVRDPIDGDFNRDAYSVGMAYVSGDLQQARLRLEYGTADGQDLAQDRQTWGVTAGYEYKVSNDWRFLANLDSLVSDSAEGDFYDGEFAEASIGYAYRPVLNDRLNLLMRLTYLHDLPGADQVAPDGETEGDAQKSRILSIDGTYDVVPKLTLGAKYGYRSAQLAPRGARAYTANRAHLGVLRADWQMARNWDVLAELRMLYTEQTRVTETGALAVVYRQVGENAKLGLGYEWGRVSDEMADIDYDGRGIFLNVVASF